MSEIQSLRSKLDAVRNSVTARINGRISQRRINSGCACTAAYLSMWSKADWDELKAETRPLIDAMRQAGADRNAIFG